MQILLLALALVLGACALGGMGLSDAAGTAPPDLALPRCIAGRACTPGNRCHQGVVRCSNGDPICDDIERVISGDPNCTLLAYWPLDGDGHEVAMGRDLSLAGGVGFADGVPGRALSLKHQASQYASRPGNDGDLNLVGANYTIQTWLSFNDLAGEQTFLEKFHGQAGAGWTLTKLASHEIEAYLSGDGITFAPNPALVPGRWYHLVLRREANTVAFFLDGAKAATRTVLVPQQPVGEPLLVGKRNDLDGRDFSFNGRIDEVAIWRRALTDSEIGQLYNGGQGARASSIN